VSSKPQLKFNLIPALHPKSTGSTRTRTSLSFTGGHLLLARLGAANAKNATSKLTARFLVSEKILFQIIN